MCHSLPSLGQLVEANIVEQEVSSLQAFDQGARFYQGLLGTTQPLPGERGPM